MLLIGCRSDHCGMTAGGARNSGKMSWRCWKEKCKQRVNIRFLLGQYTIKQYVNIENSPLYLIIHVECLILLMFIVSI